MIKKNLSKLPDKQKRLDTKKWRIEIVPAEESGTRLDRYLRRLIKGLAQGYIERMLRNGFIRLDGNRVKANTRVRAGQTLRIALRVLDSSEVPAYQEYRRQKSASPVSNPDSIKFVQREFNTMILAEGKGWLAINKPSGLAVQGGTKTRCHVDQMLKIISEDNYRRLRLVHRIDKDTSGVLLLAKTIPSARELAEAFKSRSVVKIYLALVNGVPKPTGVIKASISKGKDREKKIQIQKMGHKAYTLYERLDYVGKKLALVALRPLSGRTHQLRVHMAHLGTPICGDRKYGNDQETSVGILNPMLHLHAWQLRLTDGTVITAPIPKHIKESLEHFGLEEPSPDSLFKENVLDYM